MSNAFDISVKPEIAAAVVKIDAINDLITDVTNVNLATALTGIAGIAGDVTAIHGTDLPAVKTDTENILTNVATVDTVVDAIKLKTDATPQKVRGILSMHVLTTISAEWEEVCNVDGQGIFNWAIFRCVDAGDTIEIRLTIDGKIGTPIDHTGDAIYQHLWLADAANNNTEFHFSKRPYTDSELSSQLIEFATNITFEIRRTGGFINDVFGKICISLDTF